MFRSIFGNPTNLWTVPALPQWWSASWSFRVDNTTARLGAETPLEALLSGAGTQNRFGDLLVTA